MNALNYSIPKEIPRTKFFEGKKYGIRGITPKKSIAHNKTDALEEAQEAIDRYIRNQKKRTALSNNNRRR